MANPSPLQSLTATSHPLGDEVDLLWTLPESPPENYRVDIFKKQGADITQDEIDEIMNGNPQEGVTVIQPPNEYHGLHDMEVEDGETYYYRAVVVNTDTSEYSTSVADDAVPDFTAAPDVVDMKKLVLEAVNRIFDGRNMEKDVDVFIRKDHNVEFGKFPTVTVTRSPGTVAHKFIGDFVGTSLLEAIGEVDEDVILVTWSDTYQKRRDKLTLLFRSSKWEIRRHLMQNGVEGVQMAFGGDAIDERFQNAIVPSNSLIIRGLIQSITEHEPTGERGWPVEMKGTPVSDQEA